MGIAKHSVTEAKPHGEKYPIQKSDCIGHIQKRKGSGLQNKKKQYGKTKLSDGRTIGGAGRLTEKLCDKLQRYYGHARRDNLGDLDSMVKAAKAILHHSWSADDEPDHGYCPVGATSWCKFQCANALGETPPAHHTTIPKAVGEVIKPVFDRSCDPALLRRCLRGALRTQMSRYMLQFGNTVPRNNMLAHMLLYVLQLSTAMMVPKLLVVFWKN